MNTGLHNKTLVMYIPWGGLGDHLFWSHLPRIAKNAGYNRVFLSRQSGMRNPDYAKLIWESNPFFDGLCDEIAPHPTFGTVEPGINILDKMMFFVGLDDGKRFHEPELFYKPRFRHDVAGKTVYDPNFVSGVGRCSTAAICRFFKQDNRTIDFQLKPRGTSYPVRFAKNEIITKNVFDYCDIIASCGQFICLTSGGATLAAALGKPSVALYGQGQPRMFHHSKLHDYVVVKEPLASRTAWQTAEFLRKGVGIFRRAARTAIQESRT